MRVRALALGLLLAAHTAAAVPQPYRIEYSAPAGCSSRESFVREVLERTPLVREARDGEPAASYVVVLSTRATDLFGELVLREPDGRETRRALRGKTCDEVVSALAFIAAILVDPGALSRTRTEAPRPAWPPRVPPRADERAPSSRGGPHFRFGAGAGASFETTVSPEPAFGPLAELVVKRAATRARALVRRGVSSRDGRTRRLECGARPFHLDGGARLVLPRQPAEPRDFSSSSPCPKIEAGTSRSGKGSTPLPKKKGGSPLVSRSAPSGRLESHTGGASFPSLGTKGGVIALFLWTFNLAGN